MRNVDEWPVAACRGEGARVDPEAMTGGRGRDGWLPVVLAATWLLVSGCDPGDRSGGRPASSAPDGKAVARPVLQPLSNMVPIRAGTFLRIKFPVTISRDFWLSSHEVTQAEFERVMGRNPSHFTGDSNRPVEKVTFLDASNYCHALTLRERGAGRLPDGLEYRLPTEGEWEYACRAGSTNLFGFGNDPAAAAEFAWTGENSEAVTHPVGKKRPNAWGLYDMHGNVWEWCLDWFEPYPARPVIDPAGPASSKYKVFKGGGWNQDVEYARSANRFMMGPSNGIHFVGFRVALGVPVKPPPASGAPLPVKP